MDELIYLVLDGSQATATDDNTILTWRIDDYAFRDLRSESQFKLKLIQSQFYGVFGAFDFIAPSTAEIVCDITYLNQSNTSGRNLLGIVNVFAAEIADAAAQQISVIHNVYSDISNAMNLDVNKFNTISIKVLYKNTAITFYSAPESLNFDKSLCKFVFAVHK